MRLRATRTSVDVAASLGGRVLRRCTTPLEPVLTQSAALRAILEDPRARPRSLHAPAAALANALLAPFQDLLDASAALEFVLDPECLQLPLEVLTHRRAPVCLGKPITCTLANAATTPGSTWALQRPNSALLLSDFSADPDRACLGVASLFDHVCYVDDPASALAVLRAQGRKDVIVFSLHGVVGSDTKDHMLVGNDRLFPHDLTGLAPQLAYFDSCRLAASHGFVSALRALGTSYCIAPFIRNEAGDSSTGTMVQFFARLFRGESPELAMFNTRRSLWRLYGAFGRPQRAFRALAFRVYRLSAGAGIGRANPAR